LLEINIFELNINQVNIELHHLNMAIIAEVQSTRILIAEVQDALDLMADCYYEGTDKIIIYQKNITPEFFDLKTGLADEILQKLKKTVILLSISHEKNYAAAVVVISED